MLCVSVRVPPACVAWCPLSPRSLVAPPSRVYMSIAGGFAAGILGLTNVVGFLLYPIIILLASEPLFLYLHIVLGFAACQRPAERLAATGGLASLSSPDAACLRRRRPSALSCLWASSGTCTSPRGANVAVDKPHAGRENACHLQALDTSCALLQARAAARRHERRSDDLRSLLDVRSHFCPCEMVFSGGGRHSLYTLPHRSTLHAVGLKDVPHPHSLHFLSPSLVYNAVHLF